MATTNILASWLAGMDNSPQEFRAPVMLVPGTNIKAWMFPADEDWQIVLDGHLSGLYGDTIGYTVICHYFTPDNATGAVRIGAAIKRIEDDVDAVDGGTYGTETIANVTVGTVAGESSYANQAILKANDDALAVNESFRLKVRRNGSNSGDTHTGKAYITQISLMET